MNRIGAHKLLETGSGSRWRVGLRIALWLIIESGAAVLLMTPGELWPARLLAAAMIPACAALAWPWRGGPKPLHGDRAPPVFVLAPQAPLAEAETMALMQPAFEDAGIVAEPAMPVLAAASPGTPQDMRTTIGLFGAAILDQVETSVQTVLQENQTMREAAEEMASGALEAQGQFKNALQRTSAAEAGIGALNSVSGELAGSIRVIVVALRETATTVKNATAQAAETRLCVAAMANLSGAVASTVELIDNIARQTRMLSINASIEAARAGQAGLGFAVVADEVRGLSTQTAAATETIGGKIAELNAMVTKSVESLNQLASIIETVDASNGEIAAAIAGQEKLTVQVAGSAKDMQEAIFSLAKEVREGAQLASNSGSLAEMVLETANSVDGLMNALKANLNEIGIGMDSQSRDQDETASDRAPSPIITTPKQTAWA